MHFETGANRTSDNGKIDYEGHISPLVTRRYGQYMHNHRFVSETDIRDSDNWQKGIPIKNYVKSLCRHTEDVKIIFDGYKAFDASGKEVNLEDALCAIIFNASGHLFEILKNKEKKLE